MCLKVDIYLDQKISHILPTRCPKKEMAVACSHSRATAVFLLGHSVSSSTHSAIGWINLMEIVNNTSHGGKLFCLLELEIELRQKDPKFLN